MLIFMRLFYILRWSRHSTPSLKHQLLCCASFCTHFCERSQMHNQTVITCSTNSNSMKGFQSNFVPFPRFPGMILCETCNNVFKELLSSAKLLIELNSLECGFQSYFSLSLLLAPSTRSTSCWTGIEVMFQIRVWRVWNGCDGKMGPEIDGQVVAPDACWGSVH